MKEIEEMQKIMDAFFDSLDKEEKQKRDNERAKENAHRKDEGLKCI